MEPDKRPASDARKPDAKRFAAPEQAVRIYLLGGFRIVAGQHEITDADWRLAKAASLVKLLALSPGRRRHREELMDLLWPEIAPQAAANNLRQALYVARRVLQQADPGAVSTDDFLNREGDFIQLLASERVWIDVEQFERAADTARNQQNPELYDAAFQLYGGNLLPDDRFEEWAITRREALSSINLRLLHEAAELAEAREDYASAIDLAACIVAADRVNEAAHTVLMRLYALTGRRHDALRQYRLLESALRRELDVAPDETTRRLQADIVAQRFPERVEAPGESSTAPHQSRPLPRYLTSFVGRERDIDAVSELIAAHRLVTLTGIGGIGKTRLATVLAAELEGAFKDGIRSVDLSPVADPGLVWPAIGAVLGIPDDVDLSEPERFAGICERDLLLVLDNCEHVSDAVAEIVPVLLGAGGGVRALATSREVLHLEGEMTWQVQPLGLPATPHLSTLDSLRSSEAVGLFLDRLRYRFPDFVLTPASAPHVVAICAWLDGIPLAIEMAAARAATLSLPDLAARLENAMTLLRGGERKPVPRHETLRATLDWSYELLEPHARTVFARLAVFPGDLTLDGAEAAVAADGIDRGDVPDLLSELVDKSLVLREGDLLDTRYRYLTPVRQYAFEKLEASGELDVVNARHARFYINFAETASTGLRGPSQADWTAQLEREHDNLRSALAWVQSHDATLALRLAVALGRFWYLRGYLREGREALQTVLETTPPDEMRLRAEARYHAGILADEAGDQVAAAAELQEALELFRVLDDPARIASAMNSLGAVAHAAGDLEGASRMLEDCLAIRRELNDPHPIVSTMGNLAQLERSRGNLDRAHALLEETLTLSVEIEDDWSVALACGDLGRIALEREDHAGAVERFSRSLRIAEQLGDRGAVAEGLEGLAGAIAVLGDPLLAARLWGAAEALRESLDLPLPAPDMALYQRMLAAGRERLSEADFSATWDAGRIMSLDAAIEAGQEWAARLEHSPAAPDPVDALTARQLEIAELIARDLTNQQIAEQLDIAPRTVDTHVSNILRKLDFTSRNEVAELFDD